MVFSYMAYNARTGVVKGRLEGRHETDVRAELLKRGLKILSITPARKLPGLEAMFPSLMKVGSADLVHFARQLATMLASGGNLLRALDMLEREATNRMMRSTLSAIKKALDEGGSLSEALAEHPKVFNKLFISVVEVGEYTGRLGPALDQLADILEKDKEAKAKAVRTLMYPAAIMGLSMVTLGVLMTVAMPPLLDVFEEMDAEIPLMTRFVVAVVGWASKNYQIPGIGLVGAFGALAMARRLPRASYLMDSLMLRLPAVGPFILAGELSRFARTITLLLESGVTLANALHLAVGGCKNQELKRAFVETEESLLSGHGFISALRKYPIIPTMFIELVSLGEETNSLKRTMKDAADAYQKQLEQKLDSLLSMLEPASTLVVGGIVGIIAFSMFVPIYSGLNAVR